MQERATDTTDAGTIAALFDELRALRERTDELAEMTQRLFDNRITKDSILSLPELAANLGVAERTVRRHIARGMPTACKTKRYVRINYGEALAWISRHVKKARPKGTT